MNLFQRTALAAALFMAACQPSAAQWQVPAHSVPIGHGGGTIGFDNAPPGAAGQPLVSKGPLLSPAFGTLPNNGLAVGAADTYKGSLDGVTTGDLPLRACTLAYQITQYVAGTGWQCGINPVLPSRAVAATLNLSAFTAVHTLGYATPGDGGEATFANVTTNPLVDSYITTYTFPAGSGYTNGNYYGVIFSSGTKPLVVGTATVSGGAVTAVNIKGTPGNLCHSGDVYTTSSITGGTLSLTVTGCSAPLGSFVDTASNNFQIKVPTANAFQFGAVGDAEAGGAGTDNFNALQAGLWFAGFMSNPAHVAGGGAFWGGRFFLPQGAFLACGNNLTSVIVPNGVLLQGAGNQGAVIHKCDTFSGAVNFVELGDPNWHFACFGARIDELQLYASRSAAAGAGNAMAHSNCTQDFGGVTNTYIYGGLQTCYIYEKGYGGAATSQINNLSCSTDSASPQIIIGNTSGSGLNLGTTAIDFFSPALGGSSSGGTYQSTSGILYYGGYVTVRDGHCESMPACIEANNSGSINNGQLTVHNINGGSGSPAPSYVGTILLDAGNTPGNAKFDMIQQPGSGSAIKNNQVGGNDFNGAIVKAITCVSGACS